jgi:predicted GIY-YIG superfamily endonuclease
MRGTCYLLASKKGGTLYCGVTSDLPRRWWEHQQGLGNFTSRYGVVRLVWYEEFPWMIDAIKRYQVVAAAVEGGIDREGESRLTRSVIAPRDVLSSLSRFSSCHRSTMASIP